MFRDTTRAVVLGQTLHLHNQFIPISRLPLELLSTIFQDIATNLSFADNGNRKYHPFLSWIPETTHVCHLWREAAIQTASLWSRVNVTVSPSWALEFINRSKDASIHLTTTYREDGGRQSAINECTRHLLQRAAKRIETIAIDEIHFSCIPSLLSLISSEEGNEVASPLLRHLRIGVVLERQHRDFLFTDNNLRAPALQKLALSRCSVDWNAIGLLRNLSHLYVMGVDFSLFANIDIILNALSLMPTLAHLSLEARIGQPVFVPATRLASLPLLRVVTLRIPSQAWLFSFLRNISHDQVKDVEIRLSEETNQQALDILFNCFMQHVHASRILYAEVDLAALGHFYFHGDSNVVPWQWNHDPAITFHTQHSFPPVFWTQYLLEGLSQLLNLQELRIEMYEIVSPKTFANTFGSLPHLHTVQTSNSELDIIPALVEGIETSSTNSIPFRALQSFIVLDRYTPYSKEDGCAILGCLKKRQEFKLPLKKLVIHCTAVFGLELDLAALREVVESVIVHLPIQ